MLLLLLSIGSGFLQDGMDKTADRYPVLDGFTERLSKFLRHLVTDSEDLASVMSDDELDDDTACNECRVRHSFILTYYL